MGRVVLEVNEGWGILFRPDLAVERVHGGLMGGLKRRIGLVVLCAFAILAGICPTIRIRRRLSKGRRPQLREATALHLAGARERIN